MFNTLWQTRKLWRGVLYQTFKMHFWNHPNKKIEILEDNYISVKKEP